MSSLLLNAQRQALRAHLRDPATLHSLHHWFPIALQGNKLIWRHLPERFSTPFFADELALQAPEQRQACITGLEQLQHLRPAVAPSAFIFHTSRCGSTLLTQILATLPQCIAISEAPIIDACLRAPPAALDDAARLVLLRQMILALGQRRHDEAACIIKLDCWHLPHLPLLRAAFPHTPCWFLYREPQAILASHQRQRGPQMVPGMIFPAQLHEQVGGPVLAPGDLDGYCIQVLALLFQTALTLTQSDQGALQLLHYRQLPEVLWQQFLPQLGITPSPAQLSAMQARAGFHAKRQSSPFVGDAIPNLPARAPDSSQQLLHTLAHTLYEKLEQQRQSTANSRNALP